MSVMTVARSETLQQLRSRSLLVSLATTSLLIVALVVLPQVLDDEDRFHVGVTTDAGPGFAEVLAAVSDQSGAVVRTRTVTPEEGRAELAEGGLDAVVLGDAEVLAQESLPGELESLLRLAHEADHLGTQLAGRGLTPAEITQVMSAEPMVVTSVEEVDEHQGVREALAFIVMMFLLFLFMSSTVGLATSIVEEKSSRIVEILLVPMRPWQLLAGKLISYGAVGALQLVVVAVVGLTAAYATGLADDLPPGTGMILVVTMVGYLAGYLLLGAMAAALASLVTRQEETNNALTPMTLATVLAYGGAYVATTQPGTTLATVLTVVPPVAPISMPVHYATGSLGAAEIVLGSVLTTVSVVAMVWLAGKVYERSVLRTGERLGFFEALTTSSAAPRP